MNALTRILNRVIPQRTAPVTAAASGSTPIYKQEAVWKVFNAAVGIPDPDEVLARSGRTRADLRAVLRDSEVSQAIETRRDAVISTPWHLEGGASRGRKFVEGELTKFVPKLVRAAWEAVPYGYSVAEVVYAQKSGGIGISGVFDPPFEWFKPLPDSTLRYFPTTGEGGAFGLECDPRKFLLTVRNGTYRNPFGEALLSVLYWPCNWRVQGWNAWLDFLEVFGQPIVVGKVNSVQAFVDAMIVNGVKRSVAYKPTGPDESITTISASTSGEFEKLENALTRTIQKVILGQTLTSDVGSSGSFAAAKVHENVKDEKRRSDLTLVTGTVQTLVDNLWNLNAFSGEPPVFEMQDDTGLESARAERDATLIPVLQSAGKRFSSSYLTESYDFEDDDLEDAPTAPPNSNPNGNPDGNSNGNPNGNSNTDPNANPDGKSKGKPTASATASVIPDSGNIPATGNIPTSGNNAIVPSSGNIASSPDTGTFTPSQEVIEAGIAHLLNQGLSPISREDLKAVFIAASSREDLEARLAILLKRGDTKFAEALARAMFVANVIGYVHATEGT